MSEKRSVSGSRPIAVHASRSRPRAAAASSGVWCTTLYSAAKRAASAAPRRIAAPPMTIGSGRWTGLGSASRCSTA